jgi:hypothetical protein
MWTGFDAFAAFDASALPENQFRLPILAFGIVAPPTSQRASLEVDCCANSRAIVDGVFFDVEYDALYHGIPLTTNADTRIAVYLSDSEQPQLELALLMDIEAQRCVVVIEFSSNQNLKSCKGNVT